MLWSALIRVRSIIVFKANKSRWSIFRVGSIVFLKGKPTFQLKNVHFEAFFRWTIFSFLALKVTGRLLGQGRFLFFRKISDLVVYQGRVDYQELESTYIDYNSNALKLKNRGNLSFSLKNLSFFRKPEFFSDLSFSKSGQKKAWHRRKEGALLYSSRNRTPSRFSKFQS